MKRRRLSKAEKMLLSALPHGCYCSAGALSSITGLKQREIRTLVNSLRKKGVPVVSEQQGYALAATPQELSGTIQRLVLAASDTLKVVNSLRKTQKEMQKGSENSANEVNNSMS